MSGGAPGSAPDGAERFGAALVEVHRALDWELLGRLYCHEGGEHFFAPADREALLEAGLRFATDVGVELGERPGGRSLYLGAALAELAPMLCEALVLGRRVTAVNLPGPEVAELDRALARVGAELGLELPRFETGPLEDLPPAACDHGWMVSVLNDPGRFPALHDRLYDRAQGPLSAGGGDLEAERTRAQGLVDALLDRLAPPALLTTSDEELELVRAALERRGWRVELHERRRLSPIVGDPVRCGWIRSD